MCDNKVISSIGNLCFMAIIIGGVLNAPSHAHAVCAEVPGDINQDLVSDVVDVQCSILVTLYELSSIATDELPTCANENNSAADLDCSGDTTVVDIGLCIQISLGLELSGIVDTDGDLCHNGCEVDSPFEPCGGKVCGDPCTICEQGDSTCFETAVPKFCNTAGVCSMELPTCDEYVPCGGKVCGEPCTICDPLDATCSETEVLKYCNVEGSCAPETPTCNQDPCATILCPPEFICQDGTCVDACTLVNCAEGFVCEFGVCFYDPCGGKVCGDNCSLCDPNDTNCLETLELKSCNEAGSCEPVTPVCEVYDPCGGKVCGDNCSLCDPNDTNCLETLELKSCNEAGSCEPVTPVCEVYDPCGGKVCGDPCTICEQGDPACFETAVPKFCNTAGVCSMELPTCDEYVPCGGKVCGEPCTICDPLDATCSETEVLKYCNVEGSCAPETPTCNQDPCATILCLPGLECVEGACVCPAGSMEDCNSICTPMTNLENGTCDENLNCTLYQFDGGDCVQGCGADEFEDCTQTCQPNAMLDNPLCNTELNCDTFNFDGGECEPSVLINEYMANPSLVTDSSGEWIELFNNGGVELKTDNLELADSNGSFAPVTVGAGTVILPGDFFVAARKLDPLVNGGLVPDGTFSFSLNNSGDVIQVRYMGNLVPLDIVDYTTFDTPSGAAKQFSSNAVMSALENDFATNWCDALAMYGDGDLGTPGSPNLPCDEIIGCPPGSQECTSDNTCHPESLFCNGFSDCPLGEDELNCPESCKDGCAAAFELCLASNADITNLTTCATTADLCYAACDAGCGANEYVDCLGFCTSSAFLGNGICDASFNCLEFTLDMGDCSPSESCNFEEFDCGDSTCIPGLAVCDGTVDCTNGSDETTELCGSGSAGGGSLCADTEFECLDNGLCILMEFVCDLDADCPDASDEVGCDGGTGGGVSANDCCDLNLATGSPGCNDPNCEAKVCAADAACCSLSYDAICVSIAQSICTVCAIGECCEDTPLIAGCDAGLDAQEIQVSISGLQYEPPIAFIKAGDTVTWTNDHTSPHTVTATDSSFDSGFMAPGDAFSHTFYVPGPLSYVCSFHPGMQATVETGPTCESCIYLQSPFCFEVSYDLSCVTLATSICATECNCPPTGPAPLN